MLSVIDTSDDIAIAVTVRVNDEFAPNRLSVKLLFLISTVRGDTILTAVSLDAKTSVHYYIALYIVPFENFAMDLASDYNVDGGLLSLGEFIFLELLSEMELPQDFKQDPYSLQRMHGKEFLIKIIIKEGIVKIEVLFENTLGWIRIIGIADASCSFEAGNAPDEDGNDKKTVRYQQNGKLSHITDGTKGNQEYVDGQKIGIEVDMTTVPRRATFFVDDVEQPNFVIGIPEAVRFWTCTYYKSSSYTVIKFERLIQSTVKGVEGSKALEWGKEWE
ncbi:MAG: hypothetical protein EZS28_015253 [Streblomastix strix]|uniref:Uncharacterized protein n=1 Tax=Streblomastix strix TaxID=222440 RepID=A0A5J4W2R7_9EUKA|nr:MAG: hypothetical protein EZS28_015253 [Streblomastix strix]